MIKLIKIREIWEAIRSLLSRPYTLNYPKKPSEAPEGYRGKAIFYDEDCVGCAACAEVCPARAIKVEEVINGPKKGVRRLTLRHDTCIFCQQCEKNCITKKGIRLTTEYELSNPRRQDVFTCVEKELLFCDLCGMPIVPKEHIKWMADRIGVMTFTNPTLYLSTLKDIGASGTDNDMTPGRKHRRADRIKVLCPHCRREMTLLEEWG